jgi:hypothetical protein
MDTIEGQLALNIDGARKALGNIGRSTVYRLIATGELETRKVFGRTLITARSIRNLLKVSQDTDPAVGAASLTARENFKVGCASGEPANSTRDTAARPRSRRRCIETAAQERAR